jgi:hypothetical protein
MREIYKSGVTPQQKLVAVNSKFGNNNIQSQQGTSRILYDTIKCTGQSTVRFFEDSASRTFPLCNTGSEGNKLGVGDTMVIAQVLFELWEVVTPVGTWQDAYPLVSSTNEYNLAYCNIEIANNQVVKKLTLTESAFQYNKDTTQQNNTIDLETSIVIPPLLPFVVELQTPTALPSSIPGLDFYVSCQIIGVGGIIAPRTTF